MVHIANGKKEFEKWSKGLRVFCFGGGVVSEAGEG